MIKLFMNMNKIFKLFNKKKLKWKKKIKKINCYNKKKKKRKVICKIQIKILIYNYIIKVKFNLKNIN